MPYALQSARCASPVVTRCGLARYGRWADRGPVAYGAAYERHRLVRVEQDIPVSGLPPALDGLRVGSSPTSITAPLSPPEIVTRAVTLLHAAQPDLVVLGGDYVTFGDRAYVEPVAELLAPLADAAATGRSPFSATTTTTATCRRRCHAAGSRC